MSTGIDVALCKGFHKLTAYDMAAKCRAMLEARPTCEFAALEPGKTYCYKPPYGNRFELLTIGEVTPKRTQAVASVAGATWTQQATVPMQLALSPIIVRVALPVGLGTRSTLAALARASATAPWSFSRRATLPGSASRAKPKSGDTLPRGIGYSSALFPRGTNTSYGRENGRS